MRTTYALYAVKSMVRHGEHINYRFLIDSGMLSRRNAGNSRKNLARADS